MAPEPPADQPQEEPTDPRVPSWDKPVPSPDGDGPEEVTVDFLPEVRDAGSAKERLAHLFVHPSYTRHRLAFALIGAILVVMVGTGAMVAEHWINVDQAKDLLGLTLLPLFTLLGTVVSFFYGDPSRPRN